MNRRYLLCTVGVALCAPSAVIAAPAPSTLTALVDDWKQCWDEWLRAAEADDGGWYDSPDCLFWEARRDVALGRIRDHGVRSTDDARAMVRFAWIDADASCPGDPLPQVQGWALAELARWAGATS